jgi:Cys-tRNA(Pro)/Cys-tRNA(Cys) deacylase
MSYDYPAGGGAEGAARALDVAPERMFKSLVAEAGDRFVFALVPATAELSPKKLSRAAGVKSAQMADPRDAERITGYRVGGISPLGCRRPLPVYLDASAGRFPLICLNAGGRGRIVELAVADLVRLTGATVVDLAGAGDASQPSQS